MTQVTQTMVEVARRAMDHADGVVRIRPDVFGPESGSAWIRPTADHTARMLGTYHAAIGSAAKDTEALLMAWLTLGRGAQRWQRTYLELMQRGFERFSRKPQALLGCTTFAQAANLQADMFLDLTKNLVESNTTLLQLASQIAQDASRPLQERAGLSS